VFIGALEPEFGLNPNTEPRSTLLPQILGPRILRGGSSAAGKQFPRASCPWRMQPTEWLDPGSSGAVRPVRLKPSPAGCRWRDAAKDGWPISRTRGHRVCHSPSCSIALRTGAGDPMPADARAPSSNHCPSHRRQSASRMASDAEARDDLPKHQRRPPDCAAGGRQWLRGRALLRRAHRGRRLRSAVQSSMRAESRTLG